MPAAAGTDRIATVSAAPAQDTSGLQNFVQQNLCGPRAATDNTRAGTDNTKTGTDNPTAAQDVSDTPDKGIEPRRTSNARNTVKGDSDANSPQTKSVLSGEEKHLNDWAGKLPQAEADSFKQDMKTFDNRAAKDGLSAQEQLNTYKQIDRLTADSPKALTTADDRTHLAETEMHYAAVPTDIDQGHHNTCNVATVESRDFSRSPAAASRVISDIALTGQYKANDGTTVKVDPTPHDESKVWPTPDGMRSHASEIFQVAAVNLEWTKANPSGNIRYEQTDGFSYDTGERGKDYSTNPPKDATDKNGVAIHTPNLNCAQIADASNTITGAKDKDVVLSSVDATAGHNDGVCKVSSEDDLKHELNHLKNDHKLPAIIEVNTVNEPFYNDSGAGSAGGSGGWHVVTATDYDPKSGNVKMDNQWGTGLDHAVSSHDLYTSMQTPEDAGKMLSKDVAWNSTHNINDWTKGYDMVRHQVVTGQATPDQAEKTTTGLIDQMAASWKTTPVSENEKQRDMTELHELMNKLPKANTDRLHLVAQKDNLEPAPVTTGQTVWGAFQAMGGGGY